MKRLLLASLVLGVVATPLIAAPVRDTSDLEGVRVTVNQALDALARARAANHYDMAGHGQLAENHLHAAEKELSKAIEAARLAPR